MKTGLKMIDVETQLRGHAEARDFHVIERRTVHRPDFAGRQVEADRDRPELSDGHSAPFSSTTPMSSAGGHVGTAVLLASNPAGRFTIVVFTSLSVFPSAYARIQTTS